MEDGVRGVSVVICVYTEERWDDILAAVESLRQQTCPPQEIIIIVDHNPALLERVRAHIHDVVAVENREMRGLSGGRNTGISVARGDLIAFLDDDAVAAPDWLARLSSLCREPAVLGAGGAVDPMWIGERPDWFPEEFNWVVGCTYRGLPERRAPVRNLLGGCSCFRREIFETVGGFRNGTGRVGTRPVGGEETELCIRAHQHWPDRIWLYEPAARVAHRVPPSAPPGPTSAPAALPKDVPRP